MFGSSMHSGVLRDAVPDEGKSDGGGGTPAAEPQVDAKALQAEIDRLKAENVEKENALRYWHEAATKAKPAESKKPDEAKKSEETDEDPIEILSREGVKGLDRLMEKRGYVRADQVDSRINQKAQIIAAENELAAAYPDLKDPKSEFFQETAKHYAQLKQRGIPEHEAMRLAAEKAELDSYKSGKRLTRSEKEERESRAKAQGAGKEGKGSAAQHPDEDDKLDADQARICEAFGIDPEAYKKRAKQGVVYGRN